MRDFVCGWTLSGVLWGVRTLYGGGRSAGDEPVWEVDLVRGWTLYDGVSSSSFLVVPRDCVRSLVDESAPRIEDRRGVGK